MPNGNAGRLARLVCDAYEGYSARPWYRRTALFIGLALLAYGLGCFVADQAEWGVAFVGGAVIWFMKMLMWSVIKRSSRRPPTV
jgi:hypothetical protein